MDNMVRWLSKICQFPREREIRMGSRVSHRRLMTFVDESPVFKNSMRSRINSVRGRWLHDGEVNNRRVKSHPIQSYPNSPHWVWLDGS